MNSEDLLFLNNMVLAAKNGWHVSKADEERLRSLEFTISTALETIIRQRRNENE